jgi:nitrous oxide reductase accessory protein NosL
MRPTLHAYVPILLVLASLLVGCGEGESGQLDAAHEAVALESQEDAVCGMLVREQSAPRGQVVHRDGSRFFFCSLGDMLIHLDAPSPNGRAEAVFVEVMDPSEDPMQSHTGPHPWAKAEEAIYVVGVERVGMMGEPVLTYADLAQAGHVTQRHPGAVALDLAGLQRWWSARESSR